MADVTKNLRKQVANKVIVGLDDEDPDRALERMRLLAQAGVKTFKVGKALIDYGFLPTFLALGDELGVRVMVDGKGHDVLSTLKLAVGNPLTDVPKLQKLFGYRSFWGYTFMIEAAQAALKGMVAHLAKHPMLGDEHEGPRVIGVGHLTTLREDPAPVVEEGQPMPDYQHDLTDIGSKFTTMEAAQINLMGLARRSGVRWAVCAGEELAALKAAYPDIEYLVTAIRLPGREARGQGRPVTPEQAFRAGATAIIVAGDVMNAADPAAAFWEHVDNGMLAFAEAA